jgi:hypothetical protein
MTSRREFFGSISAALVGAGLDPDKTALAIESAPGGAEPVYVLRVGKNVGPLTQEQRAYISESLCKILGDGAKVIILDSHFDDFRILGDGRGPYSMREKIGDAYEIEATFMKFEEMKEFADWLHLPQK